MKLKSLFYSLLVLIVLVIAALPFIRSKEKLELNAESRKELKGSFIQLPSGVTHYEIAGPENGQVLVLLHGFSVPSYIWDRNFYALADSGFRVIRYDQFGRGFSDRPKTAYTASFYHNQLNELLTALHIQQPVSLAGVSMGGAIAASYAVSFPQKVNRLILVDPANTTKDIGILKTPLIGDYFNKTWFVPGLPEGQASDFYSPASIPPGYSESYLAQMQYKGFDAAILSTLRNFLSTDIHAYYEKLGAAQVPVLLVWGKQDQTVPFDEKMTSLLHARLLLVDSCGHLPQLEHPQLFNAETAKFLAGR